MTPSGHTTQTDFKKMTLASSGCEQKDQNNCYTVVAIHANQDSLYTLSALPVDTSRKNYNVIACLDLISAPSLPMKIQIMARKITENLEFKSLLPKVLFSFHFQILLFHKSDINKNEGF